MKIVITVPLFLPKWIGGAEVATYNIAKHLAERGHEVHIITTLDESLAEEEKTKEDIYIHRILSRKIRFIGVVVFWYKVLLKIRNLNPDIIHTQSLIHNAPVMFSNIIFNFPYIIYGRGSDVYFPKEPNKSISKLALKNASGVIALSEDMKKEMNKICNRDDISVLPNGIELNKFKGISEKKLFKKKEKTIIFVGSLRPVKGVKYLIKAMNTINKETDTNLIIVGDGIDKEGLKTLVEELNLQDCIHFVGKIPNEDVPRYMAQADIFALPSLSEGFPVVVVEAMASGLPIVTTNVRGLPEIIKNGENGFVVEPQNSEHMAEKILLLLKDEQLYRKISENNKVKAEEYSWDKISGELEKKYMDVCQSYCELHKKEAYKLESK